MAPAVTLDAADLSVNAPNKTAPGTRTLLLAPPSVAAHPELLDRIFEAHDRSVTDIQMLDRLDMGLVTLPAATYDTIFLLSDPDGKGAERRPLLSRGPMSKIVAALRPGGKLKSQDGTFGAAESAEKTEAILAGLSAGPDGMLKPGNTEVQSVPLRLQRKANAAGPVPLPINGKRKSLSESAPPAGVGFVDFSDDLDDEIITGEDDELIDEDTLLTEEDKARPVTIREYGPKKKIVTNPRSLQLRTVCQKPVNDAAPARTAPVA